MKVKFETEVELDIMPDDIEMAVESALDHAIQDMIKHAMIQHNKELEGHATQIGANVLRSSKLMCESANLKVAENTFLKYEIDRLEKALAATTELLDAKKNTL